MKKMLVAAAAAALTLGLSAGNSGAQDKTIAEIASTTEGFSTLVAALTAADLVGPFDSCDDPKTTVFAPTDDAFAAALAALNLTAEQLLANKALLTSVLTYHVVAGEVDAATVVGLTEAKTLNGAMISIKVVDGSVILNDTVKVVTTDIKACNGIIHVIDAVLVPPAAPAGGDLPDTGSNTTLGLVAGGLLAAGGAISIMARRRPATVKG